MNVHSSSVHKSQKVKTLNVLNVDTKGWRNTMVHPYNEIFCLKKEGNPAMCHMTEGQILCNSTYVSYIKQIPRDKGIRGYLELSREGNRDLLLNS